MIPLLCEHIPGHIGKLLVEVINSHLSDDYHGLFVICYHIILVKMFHYGLLYLFRFN